MNVGANFPSELSQDRSDQQLIIDFESESLENEDDDGDLGNLVVISLNGENTFEVLKISSELEAEILAQVKKRGLVTFLVKTCQLSTGKS